MTDEQLLVEIADLLLNAPARTEVQRFPDGIIPWFGRAAAIVSAWDVTKAVRLGMSVDRMHSVSVVDAANGYREVMTILHEAQHALRMKTAGPTSVAIPKGGVFQYFDELRKLIGQAKLDLLFVDPYLDAEFVSRYLTQVASGVHVRLLTREKVAALIPAVDAYSIESGLTISVRSTGSLHDRFVFVDKLSCYQSGASFKDGANRAPTTVTQLVDAFDSLLQTYEGFWDRSTVRR
jgi:hypothetical protein